MKIRVESRTSDQDDQNIDAATHRLATGSNRSHPVQRISSPATAVPANAAASVATCKNAPRTFRLSRDARASTAVATTFTATPAAATTATTPPRTSGGSTSRTAAATVT